MSWLSNMLFGSQAPQPQGPQVTDQQLNSLNVFLKGFSGSNKAEYKKVEGKINVAVGEIFLKHLDTDGQLNRKEFAQDLLSNQELNFHRDGAITGLGQKALKIANASNELIEAFKLEYRGRMTDKDLEVAAENLKSMSDLSNREEIRDFILNSAATGGMPFNTAEALLKFHDIRLPQKAIEGYCKVEEFGKLHNKSMEERKVAIEIILSGTDPAFITRQIVLAVGDKLLSEDYGKEITVIADSMRSSKNASPPVSINDPIAKNVNVSPPRTRAPAPLPSNPVPQQKDIQPVVPNVVITPVISKEPLTSEEANPQSMLNTLYKHVDEVDKLTQDSKEAYTDILSVGSVLLRMKGQSSEINLAFPELIVLQTVVNKFENIVNTNPSLVNIKDIIKAKDIEDLRTEYLGIL